MTRMYGINNMSNRKQIKSNILPVSMSRFDVSLDSVTLFQAQNAIMHTEG